MKKNRTTDELQGIAGAYRKNILRLAHENAFGLHLGGSLSLSEVFTVLYYHAANVDPQDPTWAGRDRVVLSKGHANIGLMTMLSMRGFFPMEDLDSFNTFGSMFTMHADVRVPGVEHSSGSLGHGVSVAIGMALAARYRKEKWKVFCIAGDGEIMEGSAWEAFMSAGHYQLGNLTYVVDRNRLSQEAYTEKGMSLDPLPEKLAAFGLFVLDVDGHDIAALVDAFDADSQGKTKVIIANTKKGSGVPGYENQPRSHFAHLNDEDYERSIALAERFYDEK